MQNIDPLVLLQPILALTLPLGALLYWWNTRGIRGIVLLLSAAAYFLAIAMKYAIQIPTLSLAEAYFGRTSVGLGLYYGLQTVFLEVGLVYLFSLYGARKRGLQQSDAVPFGLSLALWENGILLGVVQIFNLVILYLLLGSDSAQAATVYSQLLARQPDLFLPPLNLLPMALIGTLERVSSMFVHVAWGVLCVLAAVSGRKRYLFFALPMGLVDALFPFASQSIMLFEAGIFGLSAGFLAIAWRATK